MIMNILPDNILYLASILYHAFMPLYTSCIISLIHGAPFLGISISYPVSLLFSLQSPPLHEALLQLPKQQVVKVHCATEGPSKDYLLCSQRRL